MDAIKILRELGANVSVPNNERQRPMHVAALREYMNAIKILKELEADVSASNPEAISYSE